MTPSAHENSTMVKSTVTNSNTYDNPVQPPDHSQTSDVSNVPYDMVLEASDQKLQLQKRKF